MKASCPSDIVLSVTYCGDPRHYDISSNYRELKGEHEDCYVSFSGYFGPYRPETFAAAPDLLEALDLARKYMKLCLGSSFWDGPNPYPIIDAALAKARGEVDA
ncbi:hypothetical protein F9L06_10085 [Brucella anthropi]|uniref:Uncharacterized protein n=1 Tax=Brucella anthropi TaxID=529 RepID=A0A6I0DQP8_BRUAN|nr:hypothetical protein [Brucella anthropi]KAB2798944.1 hypothetical protein F9L06_10085 [Brucella anthropi]